MTTDRIAQDSSFTLPRYTAYRASTANDFFHDPFDHQRHTTAALEWEEWVRPGVEFEPYDSLGHLTYGGISTSIGTQCFGKVLRVIVETGETVQPGQPLIEVEHRAPTLAEWYEQRRHAMDAEDEARALRIRANRTIRAQLRDMGSRATSVFFLAASIIFVALLLLGQAMLAGGVFFVVILLIGWGEGD